MPTPPTPAPTPTPAPARSPNDRARSTENFGQGQSGYTAGRVEADPALQHQARNERHADGRDEHPDQLHTDDRFTGGGSLPWVPEEQAPHKEQKGS